VRVFGPGCPELPSVELAIRRTIDGGFYRIVNRNSGAPFPRVDHL
jgi:hypothetical protein